MEIALIIAAAVMPALVLVWYVYRRDRLQPEPVPQILKAALFGIMSVFVSGIFSQPLAGWYFGDGTDQITSFADSFFEAFFVAGFSEEMAKLICLMWFLRNNRYFDEYMDGIVYAACIGMGFAGAENIYYLFDNMDSWMFVGAMRAFMSVPGHCFFAIIMGYYYSLWRIEGGYKYLALALLAPVLAHGMYDFVLMSAEVSDLVQIIAYPVVFYLLYRMRKWCSLLVRTHLRNDAVTNISYPEQDAYNRNER